MCFLVKYKLVIQKVMMKFQYGKECQVASVEVLDSTILMLELRFECALSSSLGDQMFIY
jgi:hypothetical protein